MPLALVHYIVCMMRTDIFTCSLPVSLYPRPLVVRTPTVELPSAPPEVRSVLFIYLPTIRHSNSATARPKREIHHPLTRAVTPL